MPASDAEMKTLEPKCKPRTRDALRTTTQLAALQLATRKKMLYKFESLDLYNLTRCVLEAELSPDTLLESGMAVLIQAAADGHARCLKALLEGKANPMLSYSDGLLSALHAAALKGNTECAQLLLDYKADANALMSDGRTPLILAVMQKQDECVKALLPVSNVSVFDKSGYGVLHFCAMQGSEECLLALLQKTLDVDVRTGPSTGPSEPAKGWSALHLACEFNQPAMVKVLLAAGASRSARDAQQCTPLHRAAMVGNRVCAELVIAGPPKLTHAEVNAREMNGETALHLCARRGDFGLCEVLVAAGSRRELTSSVGLTPLRVAKKAHPDDAKLLALLTPPPSEPSKSTASTGSSLPPPLPSSDADLRALDAKCAEDACEESLCVACQIRALPGVGKKLKVERFVELDAGNLLRILLAAGAPADAVFSKLGRSAPAVFHAALFGHVSALKALLAGGASCTFAIDKGLSALRAAAEGGSLACVELLIGAGADANAADVMGISPLMAIALSGRRGAAMAKALIPHTDLYAVNRQGKNAFHLCASVGNTDVFEALLPLMSDVDVRSVRGEKEDDDLPFNQTALHIAASKGQHAMVAALLARGASQAAVDDSQKTPLHYAAVMAHLSCVIVLVGWPGKTELAPSLIDAGDENGFTALHLAAQKGGIKICGVLLAAGAALDAKVLSGHTALSIAQKVHPTDTELIALLSGEGPERVPGTVCAACGEKATLFCPICGGEVYCDALCMEDAKVAHKMECKARQMELEVATRVRRV